MFINDEDFKWVSRNNRRIESIFNRLHSRSYLNVMRNLNHKWDFSRQRFTKRSLQRDILTAFLFFTKERTRLRSIDIMIFDSNKHTITFFIRRFNHIAKIEDERLVLRILLMCLVEERTMKWYNELFNIVRIEINQSLIIWEDELLREFRFNRFNFLKKAKRLTFRFENSTITLN